MPRRRLHLTNGLLALTSVLLSCIFIEAYFRLAYTKPWHLQLAGDTAESDWYIDIRDNSWGLRDDEFAIPKPSNTLRVLMLGDSFTHGSGVADESAIFVERLERQLDNEYEARGIEVELLNGGIPGSLTANWVSLFAKVRDSFEPDVVVIVFFLRDGSLAPSITTFFAPVRKEVKSMGDSGFFYRYSYTVRTIQDRGERLRISNQYSRDLLVSYLGDPKETAEWRRARKNIRRIKVMAEEIGAVVGFVIFPIMVELNDRYPFQGICDTLESFAKEDGLPTCNLLPSFKGEYGPDLWISPYDQHPNPKAHEIAATAMLPFLKQLLEQAN